MPDRRELIKQALSCGAIASFPSLSNAKQNTSIIQKVIPNSGEYLSAIGMGTWITFDVGSDNSARGIRREILEEFFAHGGRLIDSSPMYGSSEEVLGYCFDQLGKKARNLFSATKVWTSNESAGRQQIADSHRLWNLPSFDLFQVHNLVGWKNHLKILNELKKEGGIRYIGVTTSHGLRHDELMAIMQKESLDFIQLTYNIIDREAEKHILPLALEKGVAVIANRPFQGGQLFNRFRNTKLPTWIRAFHCENWAQVFLKFVISHPAVTCAIPATSKVMHMRENMGAQIGNLLDDDMREKIVRYIGTV